MKKVWIAIAFVLIIFTASFIYTCHINAFSESINAIINQAVSLINTDYEACGKCIDALLEELDKSSLLLYSFSNRAKVEDIELASKSAAEYYKFRNIPELRHQLLMIQHRMNELKTSGEFSLKNLLQIKKLNGITVQLNFSTYSFMLRSSPARAYPMTFERACVTSE